MTASPKAPIEIGTLLDFHIAEAIKTLNVTEVLKWLFVSGVAAGATTFGTDLLKEFVKGYFERRKNEKIRVKVDNFEVEIQGGMSDKQITKRIEQVKAIRDDLTKDDIQIILSTTTREEDK